MLLFPAAAREIVSPAQLVKPVRTLRVVMDNNYPPYVFLNEQGKLQGILVDQWRLWEQRTGVGAEIHGMDWGDAVRRMEAGEFDVIDTLFYSERRAKLFDFTRPYAKLEVPIFFRNDISGIAGPDDLKGFVVGVKKGDAAIELLLNHGVRRLEMFNSYEEMILAVQEQRAVVLVADKPPALHYIYKYGLQDKLRSTDPLYVGEFHRAVRKGNPALLRLVQDGFDNIDPNALREIDQKWQGHDLVTLRHYLRWAGWGVIAIGAGVLILLIWNRMLHRMVRTKTRELQESERSYRELFNSSHEGIMLHDIQTGRIVDANQTALDMFGCGLAELRRRNVEDFSEGVPPYTGAEAAAHLERAVAGSPELFEWRSRRCDGQVFWTEVALKLASVGGIPRVLATIRDITERKNLEERLRQSEKLESIGLLAGGIAHDFNNQLGSIMGCADLLTRQSLDPAARENVESILASCRYAAQLTRQLLAFARKGKYQMEPVDMHRIIHETANILQRSMDKRIEIHLRLVAGQAVVNGDAGQLQNALLNLALNARDAMPAGGELRILTENQRLDAATAAGLDGLAAGLYLHLIVADTGTGMDEATLKHIFEPFFTTKTNHRGTGLGLAVVYGTVHSHKGTIRAVSIPGDGSQFDLYLPVLSSERGGAPRTEESPAPVPPPTPPPEEEPHPVLSLAPPEPAPKNRGHILIVDDEPGIVRVVVRMLEARGFTVTAFNDSREAVAFFRDYAREVDLVLLDMMMPHLGGDECFAQLQEIRADVRVLAMSGFSQEEVAQRVLARGAVGFVEKPFDMDALLTRIAAVLKTPAERDGG